MALMLKNNVLDGTEYQYTILFDGKSWVAWYIKILNVRARIAGNKVEQADGATTG
jgi:hypothetical protein